MNLGSRKKEHILARKKVKPPIDSEVPTQIKNQDLVRERRRHIIDSTVKLFIEHGYHKTTTRMIAKAANFSIGSLYEYVSSKEDLLYLVCKAIHGEVLDAVEDALSASSKEKEQLAQVIRQYFYVCDKMADHILLMYKVTQFLPDQWQKRVMENEMRITDIFVKTLTRMAVDGESGKGPAIELVAHNIAVLGQAWAFRRWYYSKHYTIDEYIAFQTEFILGISF